MNLCLDNYPIVSKNNFIDLASDQCASWQFEIDDANRDLVRNLYNYFNRLESNFDLSKGIMLYGTPGTGKTVLMKTWGRICRVPFDRFAVYNAKEVANRYAAEGDEFMKGLCCSTNGMRKRIDREFLTFYPDHKLNHICIDDLGIENTKQKYMGNEMNVLQTLIERRYELFQNYGVLTHISSNLISEQQILDLYGSRCLSRIHEMCNMVKVIGSDRRKA